MKKNLRSYISMLFLALVLFPMAEKAVHELDHLNEEHCAIEQTHFCAQEHNCNICNYIFSSSQAVLSDELVQLDQYTSFIENIFFDIVSPVISSQNYSSLSRGPPTA